MPVPGAEKLAKIRVVLDESLRVQKGGAPPIGYVDVNHALVDIQSRQNHVVFGRRGCGKSLLLHSLKKDSGKGVEVLYINCEDYKRHTYPNVLIEILIRVIQKLEADVGFALWGKKKQVKEALQEARRELGALKPRADEVTEKIREIKSAETKASAKAGITNGPVQADLDAFATEAETIQKEWENYDSKSRQLDHMLPSLKDTIRDYFDIKARSPAYVYVQLDDFYQLLPPMQPFVADYVHRLCKDTPLFFKIATLRHASVLYAERSGQPIGAQERHDYQPINVDFSLSEFRTTSEQLKKILYRFGQEAEMTEAEVDELFLGGGYQRLVIAAGGIPRDMLSMLKDLLGEVQSSGARIGKDDVRRHSLGLWKRRIEELKKDSQPGDQARLLRAIYAIQSFCLERQSNFFLVSDQELRQHDGFRVLLEKLLDYRIIHTGSTTLTHKTHVGQTFTAYMIDSGAYAHFRKLHGRMEEIDITSATAREEMRDAPVLFYKLLSDAFAAAPDQAETLLLTPEEPSPN